MWDPFVIHTKKILWDLLTYWPTYLLLLPFFLLPLSLLYPALSLPRVFSTAEQGVHGEATDGQRDNSGDEVGGGRSGGVSRASQ